MKTIKTSLTLLLVVLTASYYQDVKAQSLEPFSSYGNVSPSAESFSMTRQGSLSPSLYTGAMTYSIPVFTYEDEDFSIPISLDYFFDGLKPSAASGLVGLGWTLDCGGVITRDVMATADDERLGYNDNGVIGYAHADRVNSTWSSEREHAVSEYTDVTRNDTEAVWDLRGAEAEIEESSFDPFAGVAVTWNVDDVHPFLPSGTKYDAMSDIYHFRVGDIRGDFLLLDDRSAKVFNTSCPHGEVTVELLAATTSSFIPSIAFRIKTGDGYEYTFGGCNDWTDISKVDYSGSAGDTVSKPQITAWKLTSIKAPNGNTAEFCYSPSQYPQVDFTSTVHITPKRARGSAFTDDWQGSRTITMIHGNFHHPLDSIRVNGRAVAVFEYAARPAGHEEDIRDERRNVCNVITDISVDMQIESKNLQSIAIYNESGDLVEHADFTYAYSGRKMFLSSVAFLSKGRYSFEYERATGTFPSFETTGYDHWGYSNGVYWGMTDLHEMIPLTAADAQEVPGLYNTDPDNHFRDPDFSYAKKGAMSSIIYPSGGRTDIEYEAHSASRRLDRIHLRAPVITENTSHLQPGGIRVRRLTDKDSSGETISSRSFTYVDDSGNSSGILMNMPLYAVYLNFQYGRSPISISGFTNGCTFNQTREGHIGYSKVQEHMPDGSVIEYEFNGYDNCPDDYDFDGVDMTVSKKTGRYLTYTVTDDVALEAADKYLRLTALPLTDRSTLRGKLIRKTVYASEGGRTMLTINYSYSLPSVHTSDYYYNALLAIVRMPHTIYTAQLDSVTECTHFADGGSISTVTSFTRNPLGQVKSETVTSGDETSGLHYWYAHETGSTVLTALKSDAVKTRTANGCSYVIASEHYTYGSNGGGYRPTQIESYICTPTQYSSSVPAVSTGRASGSRISTFTYDPAYRRLVSARYPGGSGIQYTWDQNWSHILSKTVNGTGNTYSYMWKDMVGLTSIGTPSGIYQKFTYDSKNRLKYIMDHEWQVEKEYDYHFTNE